VSDARRLLRGGVLALLLGWVAPVVLLSALALALIGGPAAWPGVLAGLAAAAAFALFPLGGLQLRVPFTDQPRTNEADFRNVGVVFLSLAMILGTGGLLALLTWLWPPGLLLVGAAAVPLAVRGWRGLDRLQLVDMESGRTQRQAKDATRGRAALSG